MMMLQVPFNSWKGQNVDGIVKIDLEMTSSKVIDDSSISPPKYISNLECRTLWGLVRGLVTKKYRSLSTHEIVPCYRLVKKNLAADVKLYWTGNDYVIELLDA